MSALGSEVVAVHQQTEPIAGEAGRVAGLRMLESSRIVQMRGRIGAEIVKTAA